MKAKSELTVFSIYLMGGVASFHRNMIENRPDDTFNIQCIFLNPLHWVGKRSDNVVLEEKDCVFEFSAEPLVNIAKRLEKLISKHEGAIITNFQTELATLEIFYKPQKTIYFICQDEAYIKLATMYDHIIDVIITHNISVYEKICELLPTRKGDIHFIQHGVTIQNFQKKVNKTEGLKLVFLARHVKLKGIYDLPKIDDELLKRGINAEWAIFGDGEEKTNFVAEVQYKKNFTFFTPKTSEDVISLLKDQDVYILPSILDGLPVSLLEAMSVGCVPIVYNFSEGIKNVITDDIGYVVDKNDTIAVADKIEYLSKNRDILRKLSISCTEKINKEFDVKKQSGEYFKLYKEYKKRKKNRIINIKRITNKYKDSLILRIVFFFFNKVKKISMMLKENFTYFLLMN